MLRNIIHRLLQPFSTEESLLKHEVQSPEHLFCPLDGRCFNSDAARWQHIREKHSFCRDCDRVSSYKTYLLTTSH